MSVGRWTSVSTSNANSVASPSGSHGLSWSAPVHRYRVLKVVIDPGVRHFTRTDLPEGSAIIDGNNSRDHPSRRLDRTQTPLVRSRQMHLKSRSKS